MVPQKLREEIPQSWISDFRGERLPSWAQRDWRKLDCRSLLCSWLVKHPQMMLLRVTSKQEGVFFLTLQSPFAFPLRKT